MYANGTETAVNVPETRRKTGSAGQVWNSMLSKNRICRSRREQYAQQKPDLPFISGTICSAKTTRLVSES